MKKLECSKNTDPFGIGSRFDVLRGPHVYISIAIRVGRRILGYFTLREDRLGFRGLSLVSRRSETRGKAGKAGFWPKRSETRGEVLRGGSPRDTIDRGNREPCTFIPERTKQLSKASLEEGFLLKEVTKT